MNKPSISPIIVALENAYDYLNDRFYDNALPRPVITLSEGAKARAMGWFSPYKPWHMEGSTDGIYELNIASDYLDRGFEEVVDTLCHEMVHCYDEENGIKDCARSGSRHNKRFKESAEKHGMHWNPPTDDEASKADYKRVGYARVSLNDDVKDEVYEALKPLKEALVLYRDKRKAKEKVVKSGRQNVIKYMCPCCGNSVRATKEVKIMCMDCDQPMEPQLF